MRNKQITTAVFMLILGSTSIIIVAHQRPQDAAVDALSLIRRINTAQAEFTISKQPYTSLGKLLEQRALQDQRAQITLTDNVSGKFKSHKLLVIVSADGKRYQARLVPEQGCGVSYFSDETGIIYTGQALGCGGGQ